LSEGAISWCVKLLASNVMQINKAVSKAITRFVDTLPLSSDNKLANHFIVYI
jgi:hypothetical protein